MTQEDKNLLFKDLCARLPYGVKCNTDDKGVNIIGTLSGYVSLTDGSMSFSMSDKKYVAPDKYWQPKALFSVEKIKPYLRPLSSMTSEEKKELSRKYNWDISGNRISIRYHSEGYWDDETECPTEEYLNLFDWLNKNKFDYRGLIPMGLALEAPKDMYKQIV